LAELVNESISNAEATEITRGWLLAIEDGVDIIGFNLPGISTHWIFTMIDLAFPKPGSKVNIQNRVSDGCSVIDLPLILHLYLLFTL
jgi:hypothetical protein